MAAASGDLVVLDEAGTADTASLAEIIARCRAAGAKSCWSATRANSAPSVRAGRWPTSPSTASSTSSTEVRRFADDWEGPASLRLRDGDVTVLDEYAKHGRLVDGGTTEQAETAAARGYLADVLAGKSRC